MSTRLLTVAFVVMVVIVGALAIAVVTVPPSGHLG